MFIKTHLIAAILLSVSSLTLPPFYHNTMDLHIEMQDIASKCQGFTYEQVREYPRIGMLTYNKDANKPNKAFIVFGEHARELISPETGLHLARKLCQQTDEAKGVQENYELKMILNLNPHSRDKVEKGEFCLRENENGVDLNRNYKAHWSKEHDPQQTHTAPGPFAFSESETQTVREQLSQFKPDAFLAIHSGTLGLFAPYAYDKVLATENIDNMMGILGDVQDKHCKQCKVGSCGQQIGYLSPGTSMDYAYDDEKIPYSFTFEVFHKEIDLREKARNNNFLELQTNDRQEQIAEAELLDKQLKESSCFAQSSTMEMSDEACFMFFNPHEKDQYDYYVENWSKAILMTLDKIKDHSDKAKEDVSNANNNNNNNEE